MGMRTYLRAQESNELEKQQRILSKYGLHCHLCPAKWVLHHWYLVVRREKVTNSVASNDYFERNDVSQ